MSDIVERLRNHANGLWEKHPLGDYGICDEAAETILALRAAINAVSAAMLIGGDGAKGDFGWNITALNEARPLIRAALATEPVK